MFADPAVTVHGILQARRALEYRRRLTLLSAPGAALYAGCLFWRAMIDALGAEAQPFIAAEILDCADAPGRALEAMRIGQHALVLSPRAPGYAEVVRIAAGTGTVILSDRPPSLDLGAHGAERHLAAWLEGGTSTLSPRRP